MIYFILILICAFITYKFVYPTLKSLIYKKHEKAKVVDSILNLEEEKEVIELLKEKESLEKEIEKKKKNLEKMQKNK